MTSSASGFAAPQVPGFSEHIIPSPIRASTHSLIAAKIQHANHTDASYGDHGARSKEGAQTSAHSRRQGLITLPLDEISV